MKRSILTLTLVLSLAPSISHASFVNNYSTWQKGDKAFQQIYAQGVMDAFISNSSKGEPEWIRARRQGMENCFVAQGINPAMLVEAVNDHYKAHVGDWRLSPSSVLIHLAQSICLQDINKAREEVGLSPWEPKTGAITSH